MKKALCVLIVLALMLTGTTAAFAEPPQKNAVRELYSAEGYYVDDVGNEETYAYHVPQIVADTQAAEEINAEIAERFGGRVENQFRNMEGGYSLWSWHTEWHAYWNGTQLFLLVTADENGGFHDYAAYGYDFESGSRISNEMILEQRGISEEEYLENLKEKVQFMFEDMYSQLTEEQREAAGYDEMLEKTLNWQNMEQPMLIGRFGEIETIVKIASLAGAEWYYHLATPFVYG